MKTRNVFINLIFVFLTFLLSASDLIAGDIIVPWRAKKEIVQRGSEFVIQYRKEASEIIESVSLVGPYNTVPLELIQNKTGKWYFDEFTGADYNCELSVKVLTETPIELYDLHIKTSTGTFISRSSVKVIGEFLNHYYICHFADPHVSVSWNENGNATAPIMQALGEIISVIDPEMAICTGDNIIGFSRTPEIPKTFGERWDAFWDGTSPDGLGGMHNTRVPVFITTGNNDYDKHRVDPDEEKMYKLTDWNKYCGKRVYGFAYDETRFLAFDDYLGEAGDHARFTGSSKDFPNLQIAELEKYLALAGEGKLRIVLQHAPRRVDSTFVSNNNVQLALCGHTHRDRHTTIGTTPTNIYETAYVCFAEYWSPAYGPPAKSGMTKLRIIEIENNKVVSNESVDVMDYIQVMNGDINGKLLNIIYNTPNNGKNTTNTATLTNNINYNFTSCKMRFVMPKGKYSIDNGTLFQSFSNDTVSIYDVKVPVGPSGSISVTIKPDHRGQ